MLPKEWRLIGGVEAPHGHPDVRLVHGVSFVIVSRFHLTMKQTPTGSAP